MDVAAVMQAMLQCRPLWQQRLGEMLGLPAAEATSLAVWLAALHDLGKFSAAFQSLSPEAWPQEALGESVPRFAPGDRPRHDLLGLWLWEKRLAEALTVRVWSSAGETLDKLAAAAFGHHGKPLSRQDLGRIRADKDLGEASLAAATAYAGAATKLLVPEPLTATPPRATQPSAFLLAGLINLADWIGSNQGWFCYQGDEVSLTDYWRLAGGRAGVAVRKAGLVPPQPLSDLSFAVLTDIDDPKAEPSPAQRWALDVALPEGPMLVCLEDLTGGGKTEAAHILTDRRIALGRAAGVYWAMQTQAIANAMWARQGQMVGGLFAPGSKPSIVLAHGQAGLHEGFLASIGHRDNAPIARRPIVTGRPTRQHQAAPQPSCTRSPADGRGLSGPRRALAQGTSVGCGRCGGYTGRSRPGRAIALAYGGDLWLLGSAGGVGARDEGGHRLGKIGGGDCRSVPAQVCLRQ